jgi:hypothetical protein
MKPIKFFLVKNLICKKSNICPKKFFGNCFLWSIYAAGTGTVTSQKSETEP